MHHSKENILTNVYFLLSFFHTFLFSLNYFGFNFLKKINFGSSNFEMYSFIFFKVIYITLSKINLKHI